MSGCNEEKKGACCLYKTSDSSLTFWEVGDFLGCASEFETACNQAIVSDPTRTTIFVPDKECGPNNTGKYNDEIICPGLERGTFLYKKKTSDALESYVPLQGFSYSCECGYATHAEYMAKLTWSNNQPDFDPLMNKNEVPEYIVIPDSWSTTPCSERYQQGYNCNDPEGSFCAIVGSYPGVQDISGATPVTYPKYGCISASQTDYNTAMTRYGSFPSEYWFVGTNTLLYTPVPDSWEDKDCKERVNKCGEAEGCDISTNDSTTKVKVEEIKNCNCPDNPLGVESSNKPPYTDYQVKRRTTNKQPIPVKDTLGNIVDTFNIGDCVSVRLCDNSYVGLTQKDIPRFIDNGFSRRANVLPTELQNLYSSYYHVECVPWVNSSIEEETCYPHMDFVVANNSTIDDCIHNNSVPLLQGANLSIPSNWYWRVGTCASITDQLLSSKMKYTPGECPELRVNPCHTYTEIININTSIVWSVFPPINHFRLYQRGFFTVYDRSIKIVYADSTNSAVMQNCTQT